MTVRGIVDPFAARLISLILAIVLLSNFITMSQQPSFEDALLALQRHFGYPGFRSGQDHIVKTILSGRDTLAIMPTGGGKSICYQIPAVLRDGLEHHAAHLRRDLEGPVPMEPVERESGDRAVRVLGRVAGLWP